MRKGLKQFIIFCIVGGINTIIAYGLYVLFTYLVHYIIASVIANIIAIGNSYLMNRKITFRHVKFKTSTKKVVSNYLLYGFSWAISTLFLAMFVELAKLDPKLAGLLVIPISTLINFFGQKFWIMK